MFAEALYKFHPRVSMALRTALLQAIDCRKRTNLTTQFPIEPMGIARQKSAPERIPHAGGINNFVFGHSRDMDTFGTRIQVGAIFAACNDQHFNMVQDLIEAPTRLLGNQSELVIVTE